MKERTLQCQFAICSTVNPYQPANKSSEKPLKTTLKNTYISEPNFSKFSYDKSKKEKIYIMWIFLINEMLFTKVACKNNYLSSLKLVLCQSAGNMTLMDIV